MKKTLLTTTLAATTIFSLSCAFAADSVDVKVIGTISPVACTPTLSGGGTVDYGTIKSDTLKADSYTVLPVKSLDFAITCDGSAKVGIRSVNGRTNTLAGVTEGTGGGNLAPAPLASPYAFGLGAVKGKNTGGYSVGLFDTTADGVSVDGIFKNDAGGPWTANSTNSLLGVIPYTASYAATGTLTPVAFKTLTGKLKVQAYINKGSELDLTNPIQLDGLTTLELVYL
jgi:type 1 fimbria pilin